MSVRLPSVLYLAKHAVLGVVVGASIALMLYLYRVLLRLFEHIDGYKLGGFPLGLLASITVGLYLSMLIAVYLTTSGRPGSGTHYVLTSLHLRDGRMSLRDTFLKPLAAVLTAASGGSVGLEGPSLVLGGGIGYRLHRWLGGDSKTAMLAGAAAGLAAVFRAPLTGLLFALEIPFKRDLYAEVYLEASVASVSSYLVIGLLMGGEKIFEITGGPLEVPATRLLVSSLVIGLAMALAALVYVYTFHRSEDILSVVITSPETFYLAPLVGGALIFSIGILEPEALGIGYEYISKIYSGAVEASLAVAVTIFVAKLATTIATFSFGGSGGLFIPAIFMGSILGYGLGPLLGIDPRAAAAIGAASFLAASHKVLLSPVAFIAETIGPGYILPAIVASAVGYFLSGAAGLETLQPYTRVEEAEMALERAVYSLPPDMVRVARRILVRGVMIPEPVRLRHSMSVTEAIEFYARNPFRMLPVVDDNDRLLGVVTLEQLLAIEEEEGGKRLGEIELEEPLTARPGDNIVDVALRMLDAGKDHAYIVDSEGRLLGVITGIDIVRILLKMVPLHLGLEEAKKRAEEALRLERAGVETHR